MPVGTKPTGTGSERRRWESNPCTGLCRPLPEPLGHVAETQTLSACLASAQPSGEHGQMISLRLGLILTPALAAIVSCSAPVAEPTETDPCSRRVGIAAAAIDIDDQVGLLDEAISICSDLESFALALDSHPGTIGVEPVVFAARRCSRSNLTSIRAAPICQDPAVALLIGGGSSDSESTLNPAGEGLAYTGTNLADAQVTILPDADTPFEGERPVAIVRMVDLAFSDGCAGLEAEFDYWSTLVDDPGIGEEASVYARHALDLQAFIGCQNS